MTQDQGRRRTANELRHILANCDRLGSHENGCRRRHGLCPSDAPNRPQTLATIICCDVPDTTVLPIFWTLGNVGPMSDEGRGGAFPHQTPFSRRRRPEQLVRGSSDMKRAMFSVLAVVVLAGLTGCITQRGPRPTACMGGSCAQAPENCQSCPDPNGDCSDPGRRDSAAGRAVGVAARCAAVAASGEEAGQSRTGHRHHHLSLLHQSRPARLPRQESAQHRAVMWFSRIVRREGGPTFRRPLTGRAWVPCPRSPWA